METAMKASLAVAALALAFGIVAMSSPEGRAQSPRSYRYCSMHNGGGTDCYFNDRKECASQGSHRCIDNPGFIGDGDARAQASAVPHRKAR
jgi:hypothetical protein